MQREISLKDILLEIKNINSNMITKEDAKEFATKEDVKEIREEIYEIKSEINEIKKEVQEHTKILEKHTKEIRKIKKDVAEINFVLNGLAADIGMLDKRTRCLVVYGDGKIPVV